MLTSEKQKSTFLLLAGIGILPVGLFYGLVPTLEISHIFDISVSSASGQHMFRAIMGLYLAFGLFWIVSALKPRLMQTALLSLVIFTVGLSAGRILSLLVDGWPHWLLFIFLVLEAGFGTLALLLLQQSQ
jgi:hypothetical protein